MNNQELSTPVHQTIYTVTEISFLLKSMIEGNFSQIKIRGELSSVKQHASGHTYFTLKDQDSIIDGVCWRGTATHFKNLLNDGLEVICAGRLTTYPSRSKYQIIVEALELAGEGALLKLLEERKKKLASEGLFELSRKKKIPLLPKVIGIVTSPTGAVIRDMIHRLEDRFPRPIVLWPVLVQGQGAAEQIAAAIKGFNDLPLDGPLPRPDLLIVARGGGSLEDLWAFNEEIVVRAAADSNIPLISAIGHETDVTLIDFAADYRAPTPTAAAEKAVPVRLEMVKLVTELSGRLSRSGQRSYEDKLLRLDDWQERFLKALSLYLREKTMHLAALRPRSPLDLTERLNERLTHTVIRLRPAISHVLKEKQLLLQRVTDLLDSYSYTKVLQRGFCLVKDHQSIIHRGNELRPQQRVELNFYDKIVPAIITNSFDYSKKTIKNSEKKINFQPNLW